MSTGKGYKVTAAGIVKATAWGTAVLATQYHGFPFLSESISGPELDSDDSLTGNVWGNEPNLPNQSHSGTLEGYMRYSAHTPFLIALAMGTAGAPVTTATASVQVHTISLADAPTVFATLVIDKDTDVWEYDSCVIDTLTISATAGGRTTITPTFLCRNLARNTSSGTNNNTTKTSITTRYASSRGFDTVYFSQGRFRMNASSGGALGSGDEICPAAFEITLNNNYSTDFLACDDNPKLLAQPGRQGRPSVSGYFEFPERTAQTFDSYFWDQTLVKFDLLFTSTLLIGGSTYWTIQFDFPYARVTSPNNASVSGSERIPNRIDFMAYSVPSDVATPTGMSHKAAFEVYATNKIATALLA